MNLYFHFFDKENNEHIKVDKNTTSLKTNLENFNLKLFELESSVDLRSVTNTTLVIEKENKGVYYHYKAISGEYDVYEKSFNFKNVKLVNDNDSEKYRIVVEFKENGIVVYNTKEYAKELFYKPVADEFNIDVHEAKRIDNVFELQNENDEEVSFTFTVDTYAQNTTLQLRWWFDYNQNSDSDVKFEPLGAASKIFKQNKSVIDFYENQTFIHIELKDVFGNIRKKSYKILAPGNTYSLFEIFNEPIIINSLDVLNKLFIDYRNCSSIRPVIEYTSDKTTRVTVSDKIFGEAYYNKNSFEFKLSELFSEEELKLSQKFNLSFKLNESESKSGFVEIIIDNKKPVIKLSNLDEDNYLLIVDEKKTEQINGMIFDESLFFVGSESRKCGFEGVTDKLFIHSEKELTSVTFANGEESFLYSYGKYYVCEDKRGDFELFDSDGLVENTKYQFVRHWHQDDQKHFYMMLEKNQLSNYEKNIITNQGGLLLKGPLADVLTKQQFINFAEFYFIEVEVPITESNVYPFSVGIADFEYDFSKYFYDQNISCRINQYKELDMNFDTTRMIFIASKTPTDVILFNNIEKIKNLKTYVADEITFCAISKKGDEFFTTIEAVTFIDQELNTLPFEKIHFKPVVKDENGVDVKIENFTMTEIENINEKSYNINFEVPIEDGENVFNLTVADKTGQSETTTFILEKNTKLVEFKLQESEMTDSEIFADEDGTYNLINNKENCFVKILVFNETRKEKVSERFLIVNNGKKTEKHRIQTKNGTRYVALYLSTSTIGETYTLSYNEYSGELMKVNTKKQDELFLKIENDFIVGSNYYHLNYFKDDFSTVSIECTNRQSFRCELHGEYIEIVRTKNSNFIEELMITITVNDKNGNYSHVSRVIKGRFYNETVISDYRIEGLDENGGKIDEPVYNLIVKSQECANILYMTVYDEAELNVYKRKRTAYYNEQAEAYIFEKLTSPITPSSIKINVHVKGQEELVLERELFKDNNIYYKKSNNKVLTSLNKNEESVFIEMYTSEYTEIYDLVQIIVNDEVMVSNQNVRINTSNPVVEKINISDLPITSSIYCKYVNKKGIVNYSKIFSLDFNIRQLNVNVSHNFDKKLMSEKEANTIYLDRFENKKVFISCVNTMGESANCELKTGSQTLNIFKAGDIYKIRMTLVDKNSKRTFYQNTIQVYDKLSDLIEV
ncbi:MAG: hypothetical protein ACRC0G_09535, partial [Fusobacteriaceae bacterium]